MLDFFIVLIFVFCYNLSNQLEDLFMQKLVIKAIEEAKTLINSSSFTLYELKDVIEKLHKKALNDLSCIDSVLSVLKNASDDLNGKDSAIEKLNSTRKERCDDIDTYRKIVDQINSARTPLEQASSWLHQIIEDSK